MPILLVTGFGYDPTHSLVRTSNEGHSAVLYKPFNPQQLREEIRHAIHEALDPHEMLLPTPRRLQVRQVLAPLEPDRLLRAYAANGPLPDDAPARQKPAEPAGRTIAPREPICVSDPSSRGVPAVCRADLAVIVGWETSGAEPEEAMEHVLGFTAATSLKLLPDPHDDALPAPGGLLHALGPAVITADEFRPADPLAVRAALNGRSVQQHDLPNWPRIVANSVSRLSRRMTLKPGTIILVDAPAPAGAAPAVAIRLRPGDVLRTEIAGMDPLINPIEAV